MQQVCGEDQELSFGRLEFELPVSHLTGDVNTNTHAPSRRELGLAYALETVSGETCTAQYDSFKPRVATEHFKGS